MGQNCLQIEAVRLGEGGVGGCLLKMMRMVEIIRNNSSSVGLGIY